MARQIAVDRRISARPLDTAKHDVVADDLDRSRGEITVIVRHGYQRPTTDTQPATRLPPSPSSWANRSVIARSWISTVEALCYGKEVAPDRVSAGQGPEMVQNRGGR